MRHIEDKIQIEGIKFCRAHEALALAFHVENEGRRTAQEGVRAKRMGNLAGMTDIVIPLPNGQVAFIEIKTTNGVVSKTQRDIIHKLEDRDHVVFVAKGLNQLMAILKELEAIHRV